MSKKATENELSGLHAEIAKILKQGIQPEPIVVDGEVVGYKTNAAVLNVARQFLKDNNITSTTDSKPVADLVDALPTFENESAFVRRSLN
jgi:hypothetical protein